MVTDFPAAPGQVPHDSPATPACGSDEPTAPATETVSRAELGKVIAERQAAKARARKAEEELAAMRKRLSDDGTDEAAPTPEPGWDGHTEGVATGDAADGDAANANVAATDTREPDPPAPADTETELSGLRRRLRDRDEQLAGILRDRDLRDAAVAAGAVNPDQVVALLRPRVAMRQTPAGQFAPEFLDEAGRPMLDDDGPVQRVDVFVTRFLSRPGNANLIRAGAAPGSGARPAGGTADPDTRPRTIAAFNRLPADQRRGAAMAMTRQEREHLLGLAAPTNAGFLSP